MEDTTSNFKEELAQIDDRIKDFEKQIELHSALERLHENEDFKKVVLDGYLDKESQRIFELLTIPTNLKRDQLDNLMDMLTSIRNFKGYFKKIIIDATMAPEQMDEERAFRKEFTAQKSIDNSES